MLHSHQAVYSRWGRNMAIAEAGLSKISTEQAGQWKLVWQRFRQHRRGRIALFVFLLLVLLLLIGPLFVPFDHNFVDLPTTWAAVPGTVGDGGRVHYLGTDAVGRDELSAPPDRRAGHPFDRCRFCPAHHHNRPCYRRARGLLWGLG